MCVIWPILPLNTSDFIRVDQEITPLYATLHIAQIFIRFRTHLNHMHRNISTESDGRGLMC